MLKMEDSGIDSDSRSNSNGASRTFHNASPTLFAGTHTSTLYSVKFSSEDESAKIASNVQNQGFASPAARLLTTSQLQKRLEKQILQAKKIRQKEQSLANEGVPKKLIPRNRLKVPKSHQVPVVTKTDTDPLVSWDSDSDDEFDFHPMSKGSTREITQQLIKDGYNLDLTPDDEDLDLIPPKPLDPRCICCAPNFSCHIQ